MDNISIRSNIDSIITYLLIKKLVTPIIKYPAYAAKLISSNGKVIREPSNESEKLSLTLLDRICLKLKRMLGSKVVMLNNMLYTMTQNDNFYNKLTIKGTVDQRVEIIRLNKDIKKMMESYGITLEDYLQILIESEIDDKKLLEE
jgi:hypothetical protein